MNSVALLTQQEVGIASEIISTLLSGIDAASRGTYLEAVKQFMTFSIERNATHPFQNPYNAVVAYRLHLAETYKASTANKKLSVIRQFMKVAAYHKLITLDQAYAVEGIKNIKASGKPLREWLTQDQAVELFNKPDTSTMKGKRDQLILVFGLVLGLRREEMVKITWGQFIQIGDFWVIKDLEGKGNTTNVVEVPPEYVPVILGFGREDDDTPIVAAVDKHGYKRGPMVKESVNYILSRYGVKPHMLRRTAATMVLENGGDIREVQYLLRHADQRTSENYVNTFIQLGKTPANRIKLLQ